MTAIDLLTAIGGTKSLSALDGFCKAVWSDWGAGRLTDEQAQSLAETIEAAPAGSAGKRYSRRPRPPGRGEGEIGGTAEPLSAEAQSVALARPTRFDRTAPKARRVRPHAAAARLPVHDGGARRACGSSPTPVRDRGACMMALGEIAARAGVCVTTARNALRQAAREGLLTIEERRRDKRPNLRQCRADRVARMDELDQARPEAEIAGPRVRRGRVQKNGGHG